MFPEITRPALLTNTLSSQNMSNSSIKIQCFVVAALLTFLFSCGKQVDQSVVIAKAETVLDKWVRENPVDAEQIEGASVVAVKMQDGEIYVMMMKDNSAGDLVGMHRAFFHIYLDEKLNVIRVQRGPDEIS